ncbi:MAG TPA: PTS sugar transporter subunit IIC [Gemmatimonadales bacterium]|nr:PTS sugar transporter subunit IIC [Gemmatimonadales bacterium]
MTGLALAALLTWGTLVGLDLITWPQVMIARPLVAGTVAGWLVGDVAAGAAVGAILELFALDLLPVGAARYPDYGIGAVAAAYAASGAPDVLSWGLASLLGLAVAYAGQYGIHLIRRRTAGHARANGAALDAGDPRVIRRVHLAAIARDGVRGLALTAAGLAAASAIRAWPFMTLQGTAVLQMATLGAALGVAVLGALRLAGRGAGPAWFAAGLATGLMWVVLA